MFLTKRKSQSGRYYIRWTEKGKVKSISTREKSHKKALEFFDAWRAGNGEIVSRSYTLQDLFKKRLEYVQLHHKHKTYLLYAGTFRNYLNLFKDRPLSKVVPEDLERYKQLREVSKTTINIEVRILKTTFRYAASRSIRMIKENPFSEIQQFSAPEKKRVYISDQELKLILDHIKNPVVKEVIIHAINTGMRREEILNLRYKDISLDRKCLDVLETKTNTIRIIPLSGQLYEQLYRHFYDEQGCIRLLDLNEKIYKISGDYVTHSFKKIIRKLSLPDHYKFHSLRHTAITNLLRHSGNVYISMEVAGHKSIRTTQIYLHNIPEEVRKAVDFLSVK
jgi:integrase